MGVPLPFVIPLGYPKPRVPRLRPGRASARLWLPRLAIGQTAGATQARSNAYESRLTDPGPSGELAARSLVYHEPMLRTIGVVLLQRLANLCPWDGLRSDLYRLSGVKVGKGVFIGEGVLFDKLHASSIEIGDRTAIGARTIITAHQTIPTATDLRLLYPDDVKRTVIEHDVWIMPGVIIVPGVRIGHHSVLATGAVIHKDVPPFSLVVGGGFRVAKTLSPETFAEARRAHGG